VPENGVSIAGKILCAFSAVLIVVLALGLWSLHTTERLHALNQQLVTNGMAIVRVELALIQMVSTLLRHGARALILRDAAYERLHRETYEDFEQQLVRLRGLLPDDPILEREAAAVGRRLEEYQAVFQDGIAALRAGQRDRALSLAEGPSREAGGRLLGSVEALLVQTLARLDRDVMTAGALAREARLAASASLVVSLAIGLGLAGFTARRIRRPLRTLAHAVDRVARGEYDVSLAVKGSDEMSELARRFDRMAVRLRELEQLRDNFFADVVHEFRSPLQSIRMAARLAAAEDGGAGERRWVGIMDRSLDRLLKLTNELLDVSRLSTGAARLSVSPTDLAEIAGTTATEMQPLLESKGLVLTCDFPPSIPLVSCDGWRIEQVLTNLLDNAIRFTEPGGRITVRARAEGDYVVLTVEDTGRGIAADHLPHIFDRYRQAHHGRDGTGLGLALVKAVVEAHGGHAWAESEEGQGARIHCRLPVTPPAPR
jgi:signal transduction histidine kinase